MGEYPKFVLGQVAESREDELELCDEATMPTAGRSGERAELLKLAADLGLKPNAAWGVKRLRDAV